MAVGRYGQVAVKFKCNIECFSSGGFQTDRCLQVTGKFRWPLGQFRLYFNISYKLFLSNQNVSTNATSVLLVLERSSKMQQNKKQVPWQVFVLVGRGKTRNQSYGNCLF